MAVIAVFSGCKDMTIMFIVTLFCFIPAALGSLSICDDTPSIPTVPVPATGSSPSSDPKSAVSFLKVTELDSSSPLNTSHMDAGKCPTALFDIQWTDFLFFIIFMAELSHVYFYAIFSRSWGGSEEAGTSWLLQALYPTFQDLNPGSGKERFVITDCSHRVY